MYNTLFFIRNSADAVGEVTTCQDLQLVEFARLAKTAYGSDITTWDTSTISTVGVVIGQYNFYVFVGVSLLYFQKQYRI